MDTIEMKIAAAPRSYISAFAPDLRGMDLTGVELREVYLAGADLRGANLAQAALIDVNLANADLRGANLAGTSLRGVRAWSADFRGANLSGATVRDCDLANANLCCAQTTNLSLAGTDLRNASFGSESDAVPVDQDNVALGKGVNAREMLAQAIECAAHYPDLDSFSGSSEGQLFARWVRALPQGNRNGVVVKSSYSHHDNGWIWYLVVQGLTVAVVRSSSGCYAGRRWKDSLRVDQLRSVEEARSRAQSAHAHGVAW